MNDQRREIVLEGRIFLKSALSFWGEKDYWLPYFPDVTALARDDKNNELIDEIGTFLDYVSVSKLPGAPRTCFLNLAGAMVGGRTSR